MSGELFPTDNYNPNMAQHTFSSSFDLSLNSSSPSSSSSSSPAASSLLSTSSSLFNQSFNGMSSLDMYTSFLLAVGQDSKDPAAQYRNRLTHYLMGIGGSIVCCLGTVANSMSVAVLTRTSMKSSTYIYLAALAICDSLVLFFTLLLVLKDTKHPDSSEQLDTYHAVLYPFVHPTAIVFQVTSIWLTLAFTVDRYIMICHPFKAEHMCRRSRARRVVVGIYIGGIVFNIPRFLEYYTKTDEFKIENTTLVFKSYGVMTTEIADNDYFREIVHSWGYLIFVCGIPFLTLLVLNAFLIRAVKESRLKGKEINPKEKHRNDTTIMLIGVIIIFLICQGPALVSRMTYAFSPGTTRNKTVFTLQEVASFLVILNSAINIVPYYLFGRKFRSEFLRIFCSCFIDKDEMRRVVRSYSMSMDHRMQGNCNNDGNVIEMNGLAPLNKPRVTNLRGSDSSMDVLDNPCVIESTYPRKTISMASTHLKNSSCYTEHNNTRYSNGNVQPTTVHSLSYDHYNHHCHQQQFLASPLIHRQHNHDHSSPTHYNSLAAYNDIDPINHNTKTTIDDTHGDSSTAQTIDGSILPANGGTINSGSTKTPNNCSSTSVGNANGSFSMEQHWGYNNNNNNNNLHGRSAANNIRMKESRERSLSNSSSSNDGKQPERQQHYYGKYMSISTNIEPISTTSYPQKGGIKKGYNW